MLSGVHEHHRQTAHLERHTTATRSTFATYIMVIWLVVLEKLKNFVRMLVRRAAASNMKIRFTYYGLTVCGVLWCGNTSQT